MKVSGLSQFVYQLRVYLFGDQVFYRECWEEVTLKYIAIVTTQLQFTILIKPGNGKFHAYCPRLKGLHTEGVTKEEATLSATDAVRVYIESMVKHQDPLPTDTAVSVVFDARPVPYKE